MELPEIERTLETRFSDLSRHPDHWQGHERDCHVIVAADAEADRIRVMVPVAEVDRPDAPTFRRLLEANFAATLDARYGIYDGVLWAVFVAPLSLMNAHRLEAAITQVVALSHSTGNAYCAVPSALGRTFEQLHLIL